MAALVITPNDLRFAKPPIEDDEAQQMIDDALAMAARIAPCILEADFDAPEAAMAILRRAIYRWNEAGAGSRTQVTSGPFSQTVDTTATRRGLFWPMEISDLQNLCGSDAGGAFSVDTVTSNAAVHSQICTLYFGGQYCSCGAILTALFPLYEV